MANYDSKFTGEEIDGRLESVGTGSDAPDRGGSAFARIAALRDEGTLRALYEDAGAKWNADTGYYELNGLTDITPAQMLRIYNCGPYVPSAAATRQYSLNRSVRTTLPNRMDYYAYFYIDSDLSYAFSSCVNMEAVKFSRATSTENVGMEPSTLENCFSNCTKLRKVFEYIEVSKCASFKQAFNQCAALEEVRLKGLKSSVSFADSPKLNRDSVLYLVENSAATSPITVTLHPDAYAMATADSGIQAALEKKLNVSLASA